MSLESKKQNTKYSELLPNNFKVTKNIPIDTRFIVSDWSLLNTEIPLNKRYNGLLFFVCEGANQIGTNDLIHGKYYCFEDDLNTPVPFYETITRYDVNQLNAWESDALKYTNLNNRLNNIGTTPAGKIVYLYDLEIAVVFDGTNWNYLAGTYVIATETDWDTLPANFKVSEKLVKIGTATSLIEKVVLNNLTLSDPVIIWNQPTVPTAEYLQNWHYYNWNGWLYICLDGNLYRLNDKIYTMTYTNLAQDSNSLIVHNLGTSNIYAFYRIYNLENDEFPQVMTGSLDFEIVNDNVIRFVNQIALSKIEITIVSLR